MYEFKLYIVGQTPKTSETVKNLEQYLRENCTDEYTLSVIDVLRDIKEALENRIFATPTLVRINPQPEKRAFGNFLPVDETLNLLFK